MKASSRLVKDEESKVHSSKRAKCGCQKETNIHGKHGKQLEEECNYVYKL